MTLDKLSGLLPLIVNDKYGCRIVQCLQELEVNSGLTSCTSTYVMQNCVEMAVQRWGKFVLYNWIRLNPSTSIPYLLNSLYQDLYKLSISKQGYLVVIAIIQNANNDLLQQIMPTFYSFTKVQNLALVKNK